jgi:hypothetical protein
VTLKNVWQNGEYQTNRPLVSALWILLGLVALAYGIARYLKKSGRLNDELVPQPATAAVH